MPTVIIHSVSGQIAEDLALFEAYIESCVTVDADIAQVVIEPLLRDVITLIDLTVGLRVLLPILTHFFLDINLPQLLIELNIATREDQDIIQRGRSCDRHIDPFPQLRGVQSNTVILSLSVTPCRL